VDLDFRYNPAIANFEKIIGALDELNVDTGELRKLVFDKLIFIHGQPAFQ
jgi:hypothetical protein